jgi:hypothetical protein
VLLKCPTKNESLFRSHRVRVTGKNPSGKEIKDDGKTHQRH